MYCNIPYILDNDILHKVKHIRIHGKGHLPLSGIN
jgi:hypothetical protein